jgi:aspartate beta-hydroxylase
MSPALAAAVSAFEDGKFVQTIGLLRPIVDTDNDPRIALLLGEAYRATGDDMGLEHAADRLTAIDPVAIRPLLWKGEIWTRRQDERRAAQFYSTALARAETGHVTPALAAELARAASAVTALHNRLSVFLETYLCDHDMPPEKRSERITRSIAMMTGGADAGQTAQRPTIHFLPHLPDDGWYDAAAFAWTADMARETAAIRNELLALLSLDGVFRPYIEGDTHGPARNYQGLLNNPAWGAFYLWRDGVSVPENMARCPATAAALSKVPQPCISGRSPTAMFSLLKPRTRIPAHHGMLNARLIAHLPLIIPTGCAMRVGNETRPWREGEITLFDDSVEHEAWNDSDETRVVLLFDVARPELSAEERRAVSLCFAAVDAFGRP